MSFWNRKAEKVKEKVNKEIVEKRFVLLPPYYFSLEAIDYRNEIAELKRQLALAKDAEKHANEFAIKVSKDFLINGDSVRKLSYVRAMLQKIAEVLDP